MKREEIKISMILFLSKNEDIIKNDAEKATDFLTKLTDTLKKALPTLLFALIIFLLGILISKIIIKIINKFMKRSTVDDAAVSFLVSFIRIILYTIVIVSALTFLGVPMSSIITLIGAAGLAISLALQNCLSNLAGGFIILFSKPFKSGDTIELDTSIGVVQSINILYTKIITFDNKTVMIPNGKITDAKIINYTELPTRRLDMTFDISYNNDFEKAKQIILDIAIENKLILNEPEPVVRLGSFKESSLEISAKFWVKNEDYFEASYDIAEAVKVEFDKNNIEIPFNQLDVHMNKQ